MPMSGILQGIFRRFGRSVFRGPIWPRDDRQRRWVVVNNLLLHFRPVRVPVKTLSYTHTFGLGGMSLVLVLMLAATGVLLLFAYEPAPGIAYESIVRLQQELRFGKFVRSVHHWSANVLIIIVSLHLLRTYFTGAYFEPRQFNWVVGLLLLAGILAANFTGYLLPWDQLSYWAITVSSGMLDYVPGVGGWLKEAMLGGTGISRATLLNFYAFHTTLIPVSIFALMALHFWRVRKVGGVVIPRPPGATPPDRPERVLALPNLLYREFVVALVLIACVSLFSALFTAPLGEAANPGMSPNPAKPPWYFVGFQELLLHFHPTVAVLLLPLVGIVALFVLPYLNYEQDTSGVLFASNTGRRLAGCGALVAVAVTATLVLLDEHLIDVAVWFPRMPDVVTTGLVPVALLFAGLWGIGAWLKKRHGASRVERVQTLFVALLVTFATLTAIGVWFRGPGMALTW